MSSSSCHDQVRTWDTPCRRDGLSQATQICIHMSKRHAPKISAAVPVQTPLFTKLVSMSNIGRRFNSHQPLQSGEFDCFDTFPQAGDFLFNASFRLLDSHFLRVGLFPDPALLQIQIQSHTGLCPSNLVA